MKKANRLAPLFIALIFIAPALWARGKASYALGSHAGQPAIKKMGPRMADVYACTRLPPIQAEAAAVPAGERRVAGPGTPPASIQGSSALSPTADASRVFDVNPGSYWHIDMSRRLYAQWLIVGFDHQRSARINYIRVMPRSDSPTQIFTAACLQGSNDGTQWRTIANLNLPESQKAAKWFGWRIPSAGSYRYFKLLIPPVMFDQSQIQRFYSIGKLEMYQ